MSDDPRPVMSDPDASPEYYDEDNQPHGNGVGWDLSWGCSVSIGYRGDVPADEQLRATVSMSDEDLRRGISVRTVTAGQVRDYANMLLALVAGEPS